MNRSDKSSLLRWELCAGDLSKLLRDFEDTPSQTSLVAIKKHHEDNPAFRKLFNDDIIHVVSALENTFLFNTAKLTAVNNANISFNDEIAANIRLIPRIGNGQFENVWTDRLILTKISVKKTIKSNNLKLLRITDNCKDKKIDPVLNSSMIANLLSASYHRLEKVKQLFESEVFGIAQNICLDSRTIYHGKKSEVLRRIETCKEHNSLQCTLIHIFHYKRL